MPKLEANFMRDFSCCGLNLPTLHDLLQHYEEAHAQPSTQPLQRPSPTDQRTAPNNKAAIAAGAAAAVQEAAQRGDQGQSGNVLQPQTLQLNQGQNFGMGSNTGFSMSSGNDRDGGSSQFQSSNDMDAVEDMEMDDPVDDHMTPPGNAYDSPQMQQSPGQFGKANASRLPPLNMNMMQGRQGIRDSQPNTPVSAVRNGNNPNNNPTVSSVNTPTFMSHPLPHQQMAQFRSTPDSSAPGTPGELEDNFVGGLGDMSLQNNGFMSTNFDQGFGFGGFGNGNDMAGYCIDDPAKRLYSPGGAGNYPPNPSSRLGNAQYGADSDIAQRIREQQRLAGVPDTTAGMMPNDEPKPFRCPVIGCEKAYKNQNGLKYHKSVRHFPHPI